MLGRGDYRNKTEIEPAVRGFAAASALVGRSPGVARAPEPSHPPATRVSWAASGRIISAGHREDVGSSGFQGISQAILSCDWLATGWFAPTGM